MNRLELTVGEMGSGAKRPRRNVADTPIAASAIPAVAMVDDAAHATVETAPSWPQAAEIMEAATSPALDSDVNPLAAEAAEIDRGLTEMATVASPTEATDKAQMLLGDMQGRVKTAFEKSSRMGEDMVEFAKGNVEAMMASARIAAKASEALGQEAADYGKKSFESATAAFKSFATVKSPTELFQLQSDYAKASFDSAFAEASKMSEAMMKFAGEFTQPLSNRYALAAEKIKATTAA